MFTFFICKLAKLILLNFWDGLPKPLIDIFKFLSNDLKLTKLNQGKLDNKAKKLLPVLAKLQAKYLTLNGEEQDKVSSRSFY